jgi:hypothetical protein
VSCLSNSAVAQCIEHVWHVACITPSIACVSRMDGPRAPHALLAHAYCQGEAVLALLPSTRSYQRIELQQNSSMCHSSICHSSICPFSMMCLSLKKGGYPLDPASPFAVHRSR